MALTKDDIRLAAERLHQAEKTRQQIRQLSLDHPGITIADAYAIQKAWIEIKVAEGRVVKGHKIGLTSKAMQSALGIDEPDSGVLLDDMFFADGGLVPSDRFIGTRVEAELAFVMKQRLAGPGCTMFDVLNATDFVVPALEILDTRIERVDRETKSTRKIFDTIADNAANAGIVLGGRPLRPLDADLRWIGALCYRNGQLEETGLAAGVLNHPATSRGLARQQDRAERACARSGSGGAGGIVHPPDRDPQGRHDPGRLWTVRHGQLLFRLMDPESHRSEPPCRISRSNIPPISMRGSTWARSWKSSARPRWRPGFSRSAASASAPSVASTSPSPMASPISDFSTWCCGSAKAAISPPARRPANISSRRCPAYLDPVFASSKFALSFDMQINDKETSWKRNNIHEALKAEAAHG